LLATLFRVLAVAESFVFRQAASRARSRALRCSLPLRRPEDCICAPLSIRLTPHGVRCTFRTYNTGAGGSEGRHCGFAGLLGGWFGAVGVHAQSVAHTRVDRLIGIRTRSRCGLYSLEQLVPVDVVVSKRGGGVRPAAVSVTGRRRRRRRRRRHRRREKRGKRTRNNRSPYPANK